MSVYSCCMVITWDVSSSRDETDVDLNKSSDAETSFTLVVRAARN